MLNAFTPNLGSTSAELRSILDAQSFLGGHILGSTDAAVASALYDVLSLAFPPSLIPQEWQPIARWFSSVCRHPAVAAALRAAHLATGGVVREGGQVDLRAEPASVAALADSSVAFNAGYKKAASQRDAEDAAKGAAATGAAGGAAAPAAPAAGAASHAATSVAAPVASATQPASNKTLPEQR
jgi:hypothetical protein